LTGRKIRDNWVIPICVAAPILTFVLDKYSAQLFAGFTFGFLVLLLNGVLTFLGLLLISSKGGASKPV
jgi:hypothetical protein